MEMGFATNGIRYQGDTLATWAKYTVKYHSF